MSAIPGAAVLRDRVRELYDLLDPCRLCPRRCMAKRKSGEFGECGIGDELVISSVALHHGEEFPISGFFGSGTIFLAGCNLHCVFCQNFEISQLRQGELWTVEQTAEAMLRLEAAGAHNINWVSPTHVVPMLVDALLMARQHGLRIPLVYNTGGYDSLEVLRLLEGIVDIYMPDMKYGDAPTAHRFSGVEDYPLHNRAAVRELYRQVGPLDCDSRGIARRGLLVRHLVLPDDQAGTSEVLAFLDHEFPGPVDVNIMDQYHPAHRANDHPSLSRRLSRSEYLSALDLARSKSSLRVIE
jgi:putative pyruvate formate lyase activating enzyme